MRERDFEFVVNEWRIRELPGPVKREIGIPLKASSIVCIAGGRRVGKLIEYFQLNRRVSKQRFPKNNILYIIYDFDHERLRNLDAVRLEEMMKV